MHVCMSMVWPVVAQGRDCRLDDPARHAGNFSSCLTIRPRLRTRIFPIFTSCPFPMIIPVRCYSCSKLNGNMWDRYLQLLQSERSEREVLDELWFNRFCFRRMMLTHVDLIEKILNHRHDCHVVTFGSPARKPFGKRERMRADQTTPTPTRARIGHYPERSRHDQKRRYIVAGSPSRAHRIPSTQPRAREGQPPPLLSRDLRRKDQLALGLPECARTEAKTDVWPLPREPDLRSL